MDITVPLLDLVEPSTIDFSVRRVQYATRTRTLMP